MGTARGVRRPTRGSEAGFTLIEVLLATALFVFVALAGFEVLRHLGAAVAQLGGRAAARAQLATASARLRSDAFSAAAVWKPPSACGDAIAFLQRDAAGTTFGLYLQRGGALVRAAGPAPLDPCDPGLVTENVIATTTSFTVTPFAASALPAHVDPLAGTADDGLLLPAGIASVATDTHLRDVDGSPILAGNGVVEVTIGADPRVTVLDLVAGNQPSGFTAVLTYACGGRCAANAAFPEIRGGAYDACTSGIDFQNAPSYYVPATFALRGSGGQPQFVVTSYWVTGAYSFAFAGGAATTARRLWTPARWPPGGALVADPYPVDYASNSLAASAPAQIASDVGAAAAYAAELADCSAMNADAYFQN